METKNPTKKKSSKSCYDLRYFIKKFEAIPEKEIGYGEINNHCLL